MFNYVTLAVFKYIYLDKLRITAVNGGQFRVVCSSAGYMLFSRMAFTAS